MADYVVRIQGEDNLSNTINQVRQNLNNVGQSTSKLDQIQQKFTRIQNSTAPLQRKLKDIKSLMAQLNLRGDSNTPIYNQMAQAAGNYADAIADATAATNVFASDTMKLQANIAVLQGVASTVLVLQGAMGLLGSENENLQRAFLKVQSAMALLNGVQTISNILNKDSILIQRLKQIKIMASTGAQTANTAATAANTVAQGANNAMTSKGTTAQSAWNVTRAVGKALLGDFSGLLLVAAAGITVYSMCTSDSTDKEKEHTDALKDRYKAQKDLTNETAESAGKLVGKYKLLQTQWNALETDAEKQKFLENNKKAFDELGISVTDLTTAEKVFSQQTNTVVKALELRARAAAAQNLMVKAWEDYYKKVAENSSSVKGGGFYNTAKAGDVISKQAAENAGIKINRNNLRKTHTLSKSDAEKVNRYRSNQASQRLEANNKEAADDRDKELKLFNKELTTAGNELQTLIQNNEFLQTPPQKADKPLEPKKHDTSNKPNYEINSIADLEAQYKKLDDELKNSKVSDERLQIINDEKASLQKQIDALKIRNGLMKAPVDKSDAEKMRDSYNDAKNSISQVKSDLEIGLIKSIDDAEKTITEINDHLRELGLKPIEITLVASTLDKKHEAYQSANSSIQQMQSDYSIGLINKDEAKAQLETINKQLTELGLKPIELYVNTEGLQTAEEAMQSFQDKMNEVGTVASSIGDIFGNLGQIIGGTGGQMLELAGQSAQAVAQIIPQIVALMGAKEGEALASGTASAAALPFPANIAAIASIVATITALFASFAGSFADGGIITGSSYHGDRMLARVNAGEMILNQRQQGNLFRALNSSGGVGGRDVNFTISGSNLRGCLKNYETKTSKYK